MTSSPTILTYSEDENTSYELQGAAINIAALLNGNILDVAVNASQEHQQRLSSRSGGTVLSVRVPTRNITPELVANALGSIAKEKGDAIVLLGSSRDGKEIAGRLSAILKCGVATDCSAVSVDSGKLKVQRAVFGGRVTSWGVINSRPAVLAIRPKTFQPPPEHDKVKVEEASLDVGESKVIVLSEAQKPISSLDLTKAERIVAVGRGLKKKEDLSLVQELASVLDASVGCSRPLSADLGWLPEESHIGLTGLQVKPKLYIALGISGQLQHIAGIKESGLIVAINTDKSAPIFQNCDYGIVGDLYQIIPEMIKILKQNRK